MLSELTMGMMGARWGTVGSDAGGGRVRRRWRNGDPRQVRAYSIAFLSRTPLTKRHRAINNIGQLAALRKSSSPPPPARPSRIRHTFRNRGRPLRVISRPRRIARWLRWIQTTRTFRRLSEAFRSLRIRDTKSAIHASLDLPVLCLLREDC